MKKYIYLLWSICFVSCSDFLDLKPDKKMDVPASVADCDLLLNDYSILNMGYPAASIIAGEEFYLISEDWNNISNIDDKNTYAWLDILPISAISWQGPYKAIFIANQVLDIMDKLPETERQSQDGRRVVGDAYFFRAFAYQQLLELYCLGYDPATASETMGLPLKYSPNLELPKGRASLAETYTQVVQDYKSAIKLLGLHAVAKSRPTKIAAHAGLARLYLNMHDFQNAYLHADSAWSQQPDLLDYNVLDPYEDMAIPRNNKEILFTALSFYSEPIGPFTARMNPDLMALYESNDLRREIYFQSNDFDIGTYGYKTNYDQSYNGTFIGLTTSEILLIRAESSARLGKFEEARHDINLLKEKRFKTGTFDPVEWDNPNVIKEIIKERRRELVFRGRRWADIKRLNYYPDSKITLQRKINNNTYTLEPNDNRFALLIPQAVTNLNPSITQNKR